MFDTLRSKLLATTAVASAALVSNTAFAQALDVTAATDGLGEVATAVALIGVAMISAIAGGIAYRWIVAFLAK